MAVRALVCLAPLLCGCSPADRSPGEPAGPPPTEVAARPHPLVRGVLRGEHAYTLGLTDWTPRTAPVVRPTGAVGQRLLLRAPVVGGRPELFNVYGRPDTRYWPSRGAAAPARWQMFGDELFFVHYRDYAKSLAGDELAEHLRAVRDPSAEVYPCPLTPEALDFSRITDLKLGDIAGGIDQRPLTGAPGRRRVDGFSLSRLNDLFDGAPQRAYKNSLPPDDRPHVHFDFWMVQPEQAELYIIRPGQFTRHRFGRPQPDGRTPKTVDIGSYTPGWEGPFYVAADRADRHFVVPGGRVFTLPADAQPGDKLTLTWDKEPVVALVHDADSGKTYAFTRTHYFHITAKPAPKPHAIPAFPGATGEEALDTVAKCGRVIRGIK